jgi:hypothetical protein
VAAALIEFASWQAHCHARWLMRDEVCTSHAGARRLGPSVIDYLRAENRALREKLGNKRLRFTDEQRRRLAVKGHALGRKPCASWALSSRQIRFFAGTAS